MSASYRKRRPPSITHKAALAAALLLLGLPALAGKCVLRDRWRPDKLLHLYAGVPVGGIFALGTDPDQPADFWRGVKWAAGVGVAKELVDAGLPGGVCSFQDAFATAVGGAIGAGLGMGVGVMRERRANGEVATTITLTWEH